MAILEVYFDYACPFCLRGHEMLLEVLNRFPAVQIEWHPCEAYPRPDRYGRHSDLCARGMYYAGENGIDLMEYHNRIYRAALLDRADIEDLQVVARVVDGLVNGGRLYEALAGGLYADRLLENNQNAWGGYQFPAVPSYRMKGKLLKSQEDVGMSKSRLLEFLKANGWGVAI